MRFAAAQRFPSLSLRRDVFDGAFVVENLPFGVPDRVRVFPHVEAPALLRGPDGLEAPHFALALDHVLEGISQIMRFETALLQVPRSQLIEGQVPEHRDQRRVREEDLPVGRGAVNADR